MSMPYVAEHCNHSRGRWFPVVEETSNLAHDYTVALRCRMRDTVAIGTYARHEDRPTRTDHRAQLRQRFKRYADEWTAQTAHLSVLSQRVMHPSYQRIIGLGADALPLIIERLSTQPDHWFWALSSISGEDPVRPEDVGRFGVMRDTWIDWGRDRGLVR